MPEMRHLLALAITVLLGAALYVAWAGVMTDQLTYTGLARELRGTWLWDLRYVAIPLYVVVALGLAEKLGSVFKGGHD
ncbi:MAG: hypothetical protein HQ481_03725 [Alphaproteobacteria bacterium]|nr:hypothetical protein [Alphaproteobacteria bacterium]